MIDVIPMKYGAAFKRIFSQPEIFSRFAQDVLGMELTIDKVLSTRSRSALSAADMTSLPRTRSGVLLYKFSMSRIRIFLTASFTTI